MLIHILNTHIEQEWDLKSLWANANYADILLVPPEFTHSAIGYKTGKSNWDLHSILKNLALFEHNQYLNVYMPSSALN